MSYEVESIEENNYLIRIFHGDLHLPEILSSWKYLIENKLKKHTYTGIINDFSNAELHITLTDLNKVMSLFKKNIKLFKNLKLAIIITSPDNMTFPMFAQSTSLLKIKPFSTIDTAKVWILQNK